jgi:hypothetical protein
MYLGVVFPDLGFLSLQSLCLTLVTNHGPVPVPLLLSLLLLHLLLGFLGLLLPLLVSLPLLLCGLLKFPCLLSAPLLFRLLLLLAQVNAQVLVVRRKLLCVVSAHFGETVVKFSRGFVQTLAEILCGHEDNGCGGMQRMVVVV